MPQDNLDHYYQQEDLVDLMEQKIPFNAFLGIHVDFFSRGDIVLSLPIKPEFIGDPNRPALHGGLLATLADTAAGMAVFSVLPKTATTSTIDLRIDYLRPGNVDQTLYAKSTVVRHGSRVCVVQTTLYQESSEQAVAVSSATYSIVQHKNLPIN